MAAVGEDSHSAGTPAIANLSHVAAFASGGSRPIVGAQLQIALPQVLPVCFPACVMTIDDFSGPEEGCLSWEVDQCTLKIGALHVLVWPYSAGLMTC